MEQFHPRSSLAHLATKGRWSKPNGSLLESLDWKFRAKTEADTPTTGGVRFTPELHVILHHKLHPSAAANYRKQNKVSAERARSRSEAKTSDEAGATPPFDPRCATVSVELLSPHQFSKGTRTSPRSLAAKRRGSSGVKVKFLRGHREDGKNFILNVNLPKWLHLHRHSSKTLQESYQATARETPGGKRTKTGGSDPTFSALSRPKGCRGRSRPFVTERDQLRVTILLPQKRHVTLSAGRRYFSGSRPTVPELFSSTCDTNFASNTE